MEQIEYGLIGSGWRSEYFLEVSRILGDRFKAVGLVSRDPAKGAAITQKWGLPTYRSIGEMLAETRPLFVLVSVAKPASLGVLKELAERGVPALAETPPAADLPGLEEVFRLTEHGAKIQVAEQYQFQPMHAARIAIAQSGKLGRLSQAQVSVTQEYHAISLIRKLLGLRFENATITARRFVSPVVAGPNRQGPPAEEKLVDISQTLAYLDFGDKLGVYDFADNQHRSYIRSWRVLVRGDRGEINNSTLKYLEDYRTAYTLELQHQDTGHDGNMEGYYHRGVQVGSEWVYKNPFIPARLSDEEIAVAACLEKMAEFAQGGPSFYDVAEAAQDHYLGMMINRAAESGEMVRTTSQVWAG